MTMKERMLAAFGIVLVLAVIIVGTAKAGDWHEPKLDAVASSVAGKPVTVWCEEKWSEWIHTGDYFGEDWSYVGGFTILSRPQVYIAPTHCGTLHALLNFGPTRTGVYYASIAMLTLLHESVHQRGITNEGETDCTALGLIPQVALSSFGFQQYAQEPYTQTVRTRRKVNGRWVTITSTRVAYRQVPNPLFQDVVLLANAWHRAAPPEYHGSCG